MKDKPGSRVFTDQQVLSNSDIAFLHGCTLGRATAVKRCVLEKFGKQAGKSGRGRPKAEEAQKIAYWQYKETFGV